jgi:hypothetical protein
MLPGVWRCQTHGETLYESNIPTHTVGLLRTHKLPHEVDGKPRKVDVDETVLRALAKRSQELLTHMPRDPYELRKIYYAQAQEKGYARAFGELIPSIFSAAFEGFYGKRFLEDVGCGVHHGHGATWPVLMVRPGTTVTMVPAKYLLMEVFLALGPRPAHLPPMSPGGAPKRDRHLLDMRFVRAIRHVLTHADSPMTLMELMTRAGCWGAFRHERDSYPQTCALVEAFKHSPMSKRMLKTRKPTSGNQ